MSDANKASDAKPRRRLPRLAFLALGFLPIIANALVVLVTVYDVRAIEHRVERTLQAMLALKGLEDLTEAAALREQAHRASGDRQNLESLRKAHAELPEMLLRVQTLVPREEFGAARLDRLASLVEQSRASLAESLAQAEQQPGSGTSPPATATQVERTTAIVAAVDELIAQKQGLLDQGLKALAARNTTTLIAVIVGVAVSVAVLGIIFAMMYRELRLTERLAATHSGALRESEQRFRRIFEESPIGILLGGSSGRIIQANPAFCRMLGGHPGQFVNSTIAELAHVEDRPVLQAAVQQGTAPDHGIEARYVTRSGAIAWASVHLRQLRTSGDGPGLLLALTEDITRQKRAEGELRQAQKMEAIGQLTGGIAHDFNNLLGVIIGNVEFLMDQAHDPAQAAMAKEILDSALSGADLTRRLLAFARRQTLQPRRIDLNAYLPSHVAILRRLLGQSITVTTILADDLWPTRADPSQVGDALLNLAINARDAMPHGGRIWIATGNTHIAAGDRNSELTPGDYVTLAVTDTGLGMPREVLERAVEPFFSTKGPGAGSGLGLSMIFGFAKQSGGHLQIESQPGLGTTVRLYLPRAHGMDAVEPDQKPGETLPQGHETVLLVDDNADMRAVARRHLVSLGYQVHEAGSGPAALRLLRDDTSFDLLFTDVVMPDGMTGYQLAAAARRLRPELKVLFTTGYSRDQPDDAALDGAAADMIRKPYRRQELAAKMRAVLET